MLDFIYRLRQEQRVPERGTVVLVCVDICFVKELVGVTL